MKTSRQVISATEPDLSREQAIPGKYEPGKYLLASIRRYQSLRTKGPTGKLLSKITVLQHRFWSAVCGADIPINANIGGGLLIPHPNGIVIHPAAIIGPNCLIMHQVTIGTTGKGTPIIEGHVDIGAGAKILGEVHIGAHALIGANAVVLKNVPANTTAVGVPARIKGNP
ncbi:serine acetyltransferase [Chlorobium phaeovibrioides]|uniref:Serine acetyltransferase n=1 Tax=Chlorobium phaeovibrioides TaxID=1094 RepID=A0A432AV11_CHLPH|nr:serine acetyltransferase [Chlorobium phaeovibrioides]KAA6231777.1 serine acetyltransferase [Chlorobium phaeovibrioides]MWV54131.1 serine acetyltransferase [Chlorobium phaeovibrioides]QEQ57663.1 serine acetyltransferase [Chlorobium phaeovibrioides]RTY34663.1 serine acetyltransferase [Chlorobium phaeovibrioides]RTY37765.1 serine acetyltransferase [Chlorobium phaeovibrioides]